MIALTDETQAVFVKALREMEVRLAWMRGILGLTEADLDKAKNSLDPDTIRSLNGE